MLIREAFLSSGFFNQLPKQFVKNVFFSSMQLSLYQSLAKKSSRRLTGSEFWKMMLFNTHSNIPAIEYFVNRNQLSVERKSKVFHAFKRNFSLLWSSTIEQLLLLSFSLLFKKVYFGILKEKKTVFGIDPPTHSIECRKISWHLFNSCITKQQLLFSTSSTDFLLSIAVIRLVFFLITEDSNSLHVHSSIAPSGCTIDESATLFHNTFTMCSLCMCLMFGGKQLKWTELGFFLSACHCFNAIEISLQSVNQEKWSFF